MVKIKKTVKFSIIIPTYNREVLITRAVESVLRQNFSNWEIIITDDGSTDNTKVTLQKYISRYKNIKYFHKENGGVGSARNYGIKKARGEFLIFLDSDDKLTNNALVIIGKRMEEYQGYEAFFFGTKDTVGRKMFHLNSSIEIANLKKMVQAKDISGEFLPCIKAQIFLKNKYTFPEDVNGGEGLLWWEIIRKHKAIYCDNIVRLYYLDAENSLIRRNLNKKNAKNVLQINKLMVKRFYKEYEKYNQKGLGEMFFVMARMQALLGESSLDSFRKGILYRGYDFKMIFLYLVAFCDYKYFVTNRLIMMGNVLNKR